MAPVLSAYAARITEATQVITGAPDELVGKLALGRKDVWTYHKKTSGDGTLIGHYTSTEDVSGLITQRKADVETATLALLETGAAAIVDFNAGGAVAKSIADAGRVLQASLDEATTKSAVDAIVDDRVVGDYSSSDADVLQTLYDLLDRQTQHDYGNKSAAFTLDFSNGNGLEQKFTLAASLGADDIGIELPAGPRKVTLQIDQDGTGGWTIPATAWPAALEWGSKGAPTFGDAADASRFVSFHFVGGVLRGHYDTNVF